MPYRQYSWPACPGCRASEHSASYAPHEQHEHIISELVTPVAQETRDAPELDSLFFARYNVPSWQLRFRILGRPEIGSRWLAASRPVAEAIVAAHAAEPKPFYGDLDSPLSVDLLRRLLGPAAGPATPPILHVAEMLPSPEEMWLRDERGRYASELLLHLGGP